MASRGDRIRTVRPVSSQHFAQGRLLEGLAGVGRALGQRPGGGVLLPFPAAQDQLGNRVLEPEDDAAGGGSGCAAQPRHGAAARFDRRSACGRPPDQRIVTAARGRPLQGELRGEPSPGANRQPASRRGMGAGSSAGWPHAGTTGSNASPAVSPIHALQGARIGRPARPRTWRRCCAACGQSYPVREPLQARRGHAPVAPVPERPVPPRSGFRASRPPGTPPVRPGPAARASLCEPRRCPRRHE